MWAIVVASRLHVLPDGFQRIRYYGFAEAVAFVVCQAVGLDNGTSAPDYIRPWHGDAKLLQESLEVVQHTAAVILGGIAPEPVAVAGAA